MCRRLLHQSRTSLLCATVDRASGDARFALKAFRRREGGAAAAAAHERLVADALGRHPMVVPCEGAFETRGALCLLFEWQPRGDLFDLLKQRGALAEPAARYYAACLVEALAHVHASGFCHRDVKPENVLLGADGRARLCDFGGAGHASERPRLSAHACTPAYMPPEARLRSGIDGVAHDWWALGVLLFECLHAESPFDEEGPPATFERLVLPPRAPPLAAAAAALLNGLCAAAPEARLRGAPALRAHRWFEGFDFEALLRGALPSPPLPPPTRVSPARPTRVEDAYPVAAGAAAAKRGTDPSTGFSPRLRISTGFGPLVELPIPWL